MPRKNQVSKPGKKKNQIGQQHFESSSTGAVSEKEYDAALAITELATGSFSQISDKISYNNTEYANANQLQDQSEIGHGGVMTGMQVSIGETPPESSGLRPTGSVSPAVAEGDRIQKSLGKKSKSVGKIGRDKKRPDVITQTPLIRNSNATERDSHNVSYKSLQGNHELGTLPDIKSNVENPDGNVPVSIKRIQPPGRPVTITNRSQENVETNLDIVALNLKEAKSDPLLMSLPIKKRKYVPEKSPPGCQTEDLAALRKNEASKPRRGRPPKVKTNESKRARLNSQDSASKQPETELPSRGAWLSQQPGVPASPQVHAEQMLPVVDIQTLLTQYPHLAPQIMPQLQKQLQQAKQAPQYSNVPEVVKALSHPTPPSPPGLGTMIPSMVESQVATPNNLATDKHPAIGTDKLRPKSEGGATNSGLESAEYGSITINMPLPASAGSIKPLVTPGGMTLHPVAVKDGVVVFRNIVRAENKSRSPGLVPIQPAPPRQPSPVSNVNVMQEIDMATRPDDDGDYPIHIAVAQGEIDIIIRLIQAMRTASLSVDVTDANKQTPLHTAVIDNQQEIVRLLLSHGARSHLRDSRGNGAIHLAVKNGSVGSLQVLLQHMSNRDNINLKNSDGFTPLHLSVLKASKEMVDMLLQAGVDINARDGKSGRTALHHACESNIQKIVELLLQNKADPNIRNYAGDTPISAASGRNYMQIVGLLVKHGADTSQKNSLPDIANVMKGTSSVVTQKLLDKVKASRPASPNTPPAPTSTTAPNLKLSLPTPAELAALSSSLRLTDSGTPGTPISPMVHLDQGVQSMLLRQQQTFSPNSPGMQQLMPPLDLVRQMAALRGVTDNQRLPSPKMEPQTPPVLSTPTGPSEQRPSFPNPTALLQMVRQQLQQHSSEDAKLLERQLMQVQASRIKQAMQVAVSQGLPSPVTPSQASPSPQSQSDGKTLVLDLQTSNKLKHEELLQALRRGIEANQSQSHQDKKPNVEELQRKMNPHICEQGNRFGEKPDADPHWSGSQSSLSPVDAHQNVLVKLEEQQEVSSTKKVKCKKQKMPKGISKKSKDANCVPSDDTQKLRDHMRQNILSKRAGDYIQVPKEEQGVYPDVDEPTDLTVPKVKREDVVQEETNKLNQGIDRNIECKESVERMETDAQIGSRHKYNVPAVVGADLKKAEEIHFERELILPSDRNDSSTTPHLTSTSTVVNHTDASYKPSSLPSNSKQSTASIDNTAEAITKVPEMSKGTFIDEVNLKEVEDTDKEGSQNVLVIPSGGSVQSQATAKFETENQNKLSPITSSPLRISHENVMFHSRLMNVSDKVRPVPGSPYRAKPVIMSRNMPLRSSVSEEQSIYKTAEIKHDQYTAPQSVTNEFIGQTSPQKVLVIPSETISDTLSSLEPVTTSIMQKEMVEADSTLHMPSEIEQTQESVSSSETSELVEQSESNMPGVIVSGHAVQTDSFRGSSSIDNIISNVARGMQDTPRAGAFPFLKLSTLPLTPTSSNGTSPVVESVESKDLKTLQMTEAYRRGFLHASQLVQSVNVESRAGIDSSDDDSTDKMDVTQTNENKTEASSETETGDGELEICMSDDDDND